MLGRIKKKKFSFLSSVQFSSNVWIWSIHGPIELKFFMQTHNTLIYILHGGDQIQSSGSNEMGTRSNEPMLESL